MRRWVGMFEDFGAMSQLNFDGPIDCVFCPVNDNLRDAKKVSYIFKIFFRGCCRWRSLGKLFLVGRRNFSMLLEKVTFQSAQLFILRNYVDLV